MPAGAAGLSVVASFYAYRYDKWGIDYTDCLRVLQESCDALGLKHVVIGDKQLPGFDCALYDLPDNLMLALLEGQRRFLCDAGERVLLVGADSVITRNPFRISDAMLAVTLGPFKDCPMNSGFLLCNEPRPCADIWQAALDRKPLEWGDDQRALWAAMQDAIAEGKDIETLKCTEHNWAPSSASDQIDSTVVHFRGPRKKFMRDWWRQHQRQQPQYIMSRS